MEGMFDRTPYMYLGRPVREDDLTSFLAGWNQFTKDVKLKPIIHDKPITGCYGKLDTEPEDIREDAGTGAREDWDGSTGG